MNMTDVIGPYESREQAQQAFNAAAGPLSIAEVRQTLVWMRLGGLLVSRSVKLTTWENRQIKALGALCDEAQAQTVVGWFSRVGVNNWVGPQPWGSSGPYRSAEDAMAVFNARVESLRLPAEPATRQIAKLSLDMALTWHQVTLTQWEGSVLDYLAAHAPIELMQALIAWIVRAAPEPAAADAPAAAGPPAELAIGCQPVR
ncbi:hypothetical protein [Catellatospora chokoriensis]|uniref:Uncharacterized protein n=1 Tax=Catellatospora chokoriensis TaxID=310353 RepID=A0A8J3KB67_9ACTN|nr:hypothetical protein [Catellatospora chokoriensis]GIF94035.1 hypothetical protein Cch02nite_74790 [Catellatospora chokoriensis]